MVVTKEARSIYVVKQAAKGTGKGLFATGDISKGAFIIEYKGERIPNEKADTLGTRYLFDLENGFSLDGSPMWNTARWVNHSCEPNAEAELDEEDGGRIRIYAATDIAEGEEITIDYGEDYFKDFIRPYGCKCALHRRIAVNAPLP